MKRQNCFTVLLLLGAALLGVIIGLDPGHRPSIASVTTETKPYEPEPPHAVPPDFLKPAQSGHPVSPVPLVHSEPNATLTNDNSPVAQTTPPESRERELYQLAETSPSAAVAIAAQLDPAQRPGGLMENLIQRWATADTLAAAAWVEMHATGEEQDRLRQQIGFTLSKSDPAEAANFVANQIPAGPTQDEAVMTVVNQWGNQDLAAAVEWVGHFPEGSLRERAVNELEGIAHYREELASSRN